MNCSKKGECNMAKEEEFYPMFKKESVMSYFQSLLPVALLVFISYPILLITMETSFVEGILIFLSISALKWFNLMVKIYPYFYN